MRQNLINFFYFYFAEWVGDLDSETGGRLGLWQICQKDELADVCSGKLADIMSMPSIPFQVSTKLLVESSLWTV